jgi:hypothetical protein
MFTRTNGKFVYADQPLGNVTEIEVWYHLGGMNYFNYKEEKRGIYVSVRQSTIEQRDGFTTKTFNMFGSGVKFFALELQRKSSKQLERVANHLAPHVSRLVELYKQDKTAASHEIVALLAAL